MSKLEERDWKQLLPELIHLIAKKLPDVLNFIRFRSVCKTWLASAPLSDPPTQFPWIYEAVVSLESRDILFGSTQFSSLQQNFYSISSGETLTINVTDHNEKDFRGAFCHNVPFVYDRAPSIGWSHYAHLHLHNPLTKRRCDLGRFPLSLYRPVVVWTGTNPLCNRTLLIVDDDLFASKPNETTALAFIDPHRQNWIVHKGSFSNAFLCQGMLFTTEADGYTMAWNLNLPSKILSHKIPPPANGIKNLLDDKERLRTLDNKELFLSMMRRVHTFIVESCGIILRVDWLTQSWKQENAEDSIFYIFKLQFDGVNGKPRWIKLNNIGHQVLFLDEKIAFSMSTRPSTGFKEGCIYFLSLYYKRPYVYDVLAGTIERVPVPSSFKRCSWFVPGLF